MNLLKKITDNKNLLRFIRTTQRRMIDSEIGNTSVIVAYYLLLSLFPLLIAIGNLLPYLNINPNHVLPYLAEIVPESIYHDLEPAFLSLLTRRSGGLLSVSALTALWSASQSINALQIAMNKAYGVKSRKNFIIVRIVSLTVILLLLLALVGIVIILGLGKNILDFLQPILKVPTSFIVTFQTLKWPVTLFVLLIIMCLIFLVVPNAKLTIRSVIPGAVFSTIGWMLLSQVFGIYIKYFNSKVAGYQIIGSFIVLILWLNFAATIIIFGGIINAVVEEYSSEKRIEKRSGMLNSTIDQIKEKFKH